MVRHGPGSNRTADFHAQHSPAGALASLTVGHFGHHGGAGCEIGGPAPGGMHVGWADGQAVHQLPFFALSASDQERYVQGQAAGATQSRLIPVDDIVRDYGWATDRFTAGDLVLDLFSPVPELPDPASAGIDAQREAFLPAVLVRLTLANPTAAVRTAFVGFSGGGNWLELVGRTGLRQRGGFGFATDDPRARTCIHFDPQTALLENPGQAGGRIAIGPCGLIAVAVEPGETRTVTVALGWYKAGPVTIGIETAYWYTRLFSGIDDVLGQALGDAARIIDQCAQRDRELERSGLSEEQRFLIAHATRSYYGSTQLLDDGGRPRWVVNEGEYLMMNTFDLTVDMAFHELRFHPWTLRNVLEQFVGEYRYADLLFQPGAAEPTVVGGVSFTHDMGVGNVFSPFGRSSYESDRLDRLCFSHMTCEQLLNWVCCAGVYWSNEQDEGFLRRHAGLLRSCLESIERRDHPEPEKRRGLMQWESSRTFPGGEITTYDSLDHSLGQARLNLYLAVKGWAACLALEAMLTALGDSEGAAAAAAEAALGATTVAAALDPALGFIPAVLDGENRSAIIPAIEGLVFPQRMGLDRAVAEDGPYGAMVVALKRHHQAVLRPGVCLYPDGGWKLSSTADNSWMSKICLCQYVARTVLGLSQSAEDEARADRAHAQWERIGSADQACSDQFRSGVPIGSRYYPRIVTNVLWLDEAEAAGRRSAKARGTALKAGIAAG